MMININDEKNEIPCVVVVLFTVVGTLNLNPNNPRYRSENIGLEIE